MEEALKRAEAYHAAGADAILIHSKKSDGAEILTFFRGMGPTLSGPHRPYDLLRYPDGCVSEVRGICRHMGKPQPACRHLRNARRFQADLSGTVRQGRRRDHCVSKRYF